MSFANNPAQTEQDRMTHHTVLIVEDDVATRRLYKFLLTNGGYAVLEAEDGVVALEQLAKHHCALIITDMNMPRMDGLQLIKKVREQHNTIHIIVVTAFGTPDTERQALRLGANEYLPKPFNFEELEQRIHTALTAQA